MSQVVLEFVIGFVIGAAICLGKEFLLQRFLLRGNKYFSMLLFWARILIDFAVLVITLVLFDVAAMVGSAFGLSVYMVIVSIQALRQGH